jgi:hypothetical protein
MAMLNMQRKETRTIRTILQVISNPYLGSVIASVNLLGVGTIQISGKTVIELVVLDYDLDRGIVGPATGQ